MNKVAPKLFSQPQQVLHLKIEMEIWYPEERKFSYDGRSHRRGQERDNTSQPGVFQLNQINRGHLHTSKMFVTYYALVSKYFINNQKTSKNNLQVCSPSIVVACWLGEAAKG